MGSFRDVKNIWDMSKACVCVCACVMFHWYLWHGFAWKMGTSIPKKCNVSRKIDFFKPEFGLKLINSDHSFLTDNLWDPLCIIG